MILIVLCERVYASVRVCASVCLATSGIACQFIDWYSMRVCLCLFEFAHAVYTCFLQILNTFSLFKMCVCLNSRMQINTCA